MYREPVEIRNQNGANQRAFVPIEEILEITDRKGRRRERLEINRRKDQARFERSH